LPTRRSSDLPLPASTRLSRAASALWWSALLLRQASRSRQNQNSDGSHAIPLFSSVGQTIGFRRLPGFFGLKAAGRKKADHQKRWSAPQAPSFLISWPRRAGRQRKHVITLLGHQAWRKRNRLGVGTLPRLGRS